MPINRTLVSIVGQVLLVLTLPLAACSAGKTVVKTVSPETQQVLTQAAVTSEETFVLKSDAGVDGGMLPIEYTCDGAGSSPALSWSGAPAGTKEFALMMTTIPVDGNTKWNWVLYGIPASTTFLESNTAGSGTGGLSSHGDTVYAPPCSQGPGAKTYTFTLYALSAVPVLPSPDQVTGDVLTKAISSITRGSASLNLSYDRQQQ